MRKPHYLVKHRSIVLDDLYTMEAAGTYHYRNGINPAAVVATVVSALIGVGIVFGVANPTVAAFSWFVGAALGFGLHLVLSATLASAKVPVDLR